MYAIHQEVFSQVHLVRLTRNCAKILGITKYTKQPFDVSVYIRGEEARIQYRLRNINTCYHQFGYKPNYHLHVLHGTQFQP